MFLVLFSFYVLSQSMTDITIFNMYIVYIYIQLPLDKWNHEGTEENGSTYQMFHLSKVFFTFAKKRKQFWRKALIKVQKQGAKVVK